MIIEERRGNILETDCLHIVFAVNTEGINDSGFAGQISRIFWPDLAYIGPQNLKTVLSHQKEDGKMFHAIVCHSLEEGWQMAPQIIKECLDALDIPDNEPIASVQIGNGFVGKHSDANFPAIIQALKDSKKSIILYRR